MQLNRVVPGDMDIFNSLMDLYELSFPENERREKDSVASLLASDIMQFLAITDNNEVVGFMILWPFAEFVFIEHFAVFASKRGAQIGQRALQNAISLFNKPVFLEVEPPIDDLSSRRIEFYRRNGFEIINTPYFQPPYSPQNEFIKLLLMSNNSLLTNTFNTNAIKVIYEQVYICLFDEYVRLAKEK